MTAQTQTQQFKMSQCAIIYAAHQKKSDSTEVKCAGFSEMKYNIQNYLFMSV